MVKFLLLALSLCFLHVNADDTWALLVAGSNSWYNYRHQADICHAYQLLTLRGFPADKIITMMYDDIADNSMNPRKGEIINQPNGTDVYHGVKIDYRGDDVNPENFLNILKGNKAAMNGIGTGRVIESGPNDNVFVNFADHGGVGLLCFPNSNLFADDLHKALTEIANENKFKKLLFYVEACEAGSMFDNILEENDKILVSTASAKDESSFGCYCDDFEIGTCLGDLYSVSWMEHMDKLTPTSQETLFHQYQAVRTATDQSHVQLYGDYSFGMNIINEFFGTKGYSTKNSNNVFKSQKGKLVPSRHVPIYVAETQVLKAKSPIDKIKARAELNKLRKMKSLAEITFENIVEQITNGKKELKNEVNIGSYNLDRNIFPCYRSLIENFNNICFNTNKNTFAVEHFKKLAYLCSATWTTEDAIVNAMEAVC